MTRKSRVFICYDFEHDEDKRLLLAEQSRLPDSPFEIADAFGEGASNRRLGGQSQEPNGRHRRGNCPVWVRILAKGMAAE